MSRLLFIDTPGWGGNPLPSTSDERSDIFDPCRFPALYWIFIVPLLSLYMFLLPELGWKLLKPSALPDKIRFTWRSGLFESDFHYPNESNDRFSTGDYYSRHLRFIAYVSIVGRWHSFCVQFADGVPKLHWPELLFWWVARDPLRSLDAIIVISNGAWRP